MTLSRHNALVMLTEDHRKVEALFERFEAAETMAAQADIVRQICDDLTIHTRLEEEIFYPALRRVVDDELLDEAIVEHDGAKLLIRDLLEAGPDENYYRAKVMVLKEEIAHHVRGEELRGTGLFAQARKAGVNLDAIGLEMLVRKEELVSLAHRGDLPVPKIEALAN